jgi:hypothetical protein
MDIGKIVREIVVKFAGFVAGKIRVDSIVPFQKKGLIAKNDPLNGAGEIERNIRHGYYLFISHDFIHPLIRLR